MKKLIFVILTFVVLYSFYQLEFVKTGNDNFSETEVTTSLAQTEENEFIFDDFVAYYLKDQEIYIVKLSNFQNLNLLYDPTNTKSLKEIIESNNLNFAINGGYFTDEKKHVGGLIINSDIINNFANNDQLTHVVALDEQHLELSFYSYEDFINLDKKNFKFAFQTGPIVINKGIIEYDFINNSLNGNEKALRSLIGKNNSNELIFIVTRKVYDLQTLAEILFEEEILGNEVTLINLDGGSSVAMYLKNLEKFQINENKILPNLITF
ncbi:MAG: hypothetical protein KatS3mg085_582 [Candidatus Dojkabacteria bacterium]|nr:MAG: hypothetical protein KatS3mg085_582 [Candidatus Dojkabacteria bacterium]